MALMVDDKHSMDGVIGGLLRSLRLHLGLDVAFIAELDEQKRVFRYVDTGLSSSPIAVGDADPADESYCRYVVEGHLPQFLSDPATHPVSAGLSATAQLPVGTHLSVPIRLSNGDVYGTLCCFALGVHDDLDERDVAVLRLIADFVADYIEERESLLTTLSELLRA